MTAAPIMSRDKKVGPAKRQDASKDGSASPIGPVSALLCAAATVCLLFLFPHQTRPWLYSGCAPLTLLLLYGSATRADAFQSTPPGTSPWSTLVFLNVVYLITSTSQLQYHCFQVACWPCVGVTVLMLSPAAAHVARRVFRRVLTRGHFVQDRIAAFNPPALHLDMGMQGLIVVRGWTFEISSLTVRVHGVEVAFNITEKMHIALYCNEIVIRIFRGIDIDPVHGVLKQEQFEIDLKNLKQPEVNEDGQEPLESTEYAFDDVDFCGPQNIPPESADKKIGPGARAKGPTADSKAQDRYDSILRRIQATSPVQQSIEEVGGAPSEGAEPLEHQKNRASVCERLENVLSVPHRPRRSIKISSILDLIPMWLRRLFARTPFLLRLILMPVSYLHPTKIAVVAISASGSWLADLLKEKVYSKYSEDRDDIKQLEQSVTGWMINATFCLDLADIQGLAQVSIRSSQDIVASCSCTSGAVMRAEPKTGEVAPALRVEGGDATVTLPSYLLPVHEHLLPPKPDSDSEEDTATIELSTHLSFPAILDSTMVDFFADLIDSAIVMQIEDVDGEAADKSSTNGNAFKRAQVKVAGQAQDVRDAIKKGMKKAAFSASNADQIAKLVRTIAQKLETMQGDVGYSGSMPVPLAGFRAEGELPKKLLS